MKQSGFAGKFEATYRDVCLPASYREFIVTDSYLPYRRSQIRGLWTYGPTYVDLTLDAPILLKRGRLFDERGIDAEETRAYHPIATIPRSPQFLAIGTTNEAGSVYLWHHETGAFHLQFESFTEFLANLRTLEQARAERASVRKAFAAIRAECGPALRASRRHFDAGQLDAAVRELDRVLEGREPVRYDGNNDFNAIGILCDCYNLWGRIRLAQGRLEDARACFLDAVSCGGLPYWEALVNVVVSSFLLGDPDRVVDRLNGVEISDFARPPGQILRENFDPAQIQQFAEAAHSYGTTEKGRTFAAKTLGWLA